MIRFLPLLMATAFAAPPSDTGPDGPPEQISYHETGPEGAGLVHWYLGSGGHGQFESVGSTPESKVRFDLNVGAGGFQKINTILALLEGRRDVQCVESGTDQASGTLSFVRGIRHVAIQLDRGCIAAPGETAFMAMDEANRIILDWVGTDKWGDLIVASPPIAPPRTANQPNCCAASRKD